ncbi:MAG: glycosyltransferase [Butyrivibrio sp.]|nr:glycosyltransferase [Butyrivibrio sp.]
MKTSVVVCTYNGSDTIIEQLESIRNQTRAVDEVIVCDDRSTDNTVEVVRNYIEKETLQNWSVHVNDKNLGYGFNFFNGVEKTHGDYVFFCDQDDIWVKDRVEKMTDVMEKNSNILLLGSEFEPFTVSEDALRVPSWELKTFKNDGSLEHLEFGPHNIFIGCQGCTMCVRKSFWDSIVPYYFEGWAHDEFVWKMALVAGGLYFYHFTSLKRRVHSGNVSLHKMRDLKKRIDFLKALKMSHEATLKYVEDKKGSVHQVELLEKNIRATDLRIELMSKRKYFNTFPLTLFYRDCYHKARAIPVELYMAIKQ